MVFCLSKKSWENSVAITSKSLLDLNKKSIFSKGIGIHLVIF